MIFTGKRAWLFVVLAVVFAGGVVVRGQSGTWYPSRWGADDQRGAANRLTAAKVLEAKNLITTGRIYPLGRLFL